MWIKVNIEVWQAKTAQLQLPVFYNAEFLMVTAKNFNVEVIFYAFEKKEKVLALGAFYVKGKKIVTPESFTFTSLWFIKRISDVAYLECAESLIQLLRLSYTEISLRLNPQIKDVRPFIWSNFKIENKYTYIKRDYSESHYSISKNLSKLLDDYYCFKVENVDQQSVEINLNFLKILGFTKKVREYFQCLIRDWDKLGIIKAFNIYKENELVCSNIALLDKADNKLYTILLNNVGSDERYAHTFLYQSIINWGKENNIIEIDLCGANLPNVAKFKSYFNPELTGYFVVNFNPFYSKIVDIKLTASLILKKLNRLIYNNY